MNARINEMLEDFANVGNRMVDTIDEVTRELTDGGRKVVILEDDFFKQLRYDEHGAYVVDNYDYEELVEGLSQDDLFTLLTLLSDEENYSIENVFTNPF